VRASYVTPNTILHEKNCNRSLYNFINESKIDVRYYETPARMFDVRLSLNSITPTFAEISPRGKSWTQIMKVPDINHESRGHKPSRCMRQSPWQVRDKPVYVALVELSPLHAREKSATKSAISSRQSRGYKSRKSATWFVSQTFMICVRDKSATLSGTCRELCRKVGVMEFGPHASNSKVVFHCCNKNDDIDSQARFSASIK